MSQNLASNSNTPSVDADATAPIFQPVPLGAPLTGLEPVGTRRVEIIPGCLLVLTMIAVGSGLILSVLLAEPEPTVAVAIVSATPLPTIQASPTPFQATATRSAATSRPAPTASLIRATEPASEPSATKVSTTSSVSSAPTASDAEMDLLNRINGFRAQNNLPPYTLNDTLAAAARRHSQDMAGSGRIDHVGSDGSTARDRIADAGYSGTATGEMIYGGQVSLDDAWNFWSTDQWHVPALLSTDYTEMGIGIVKVGNRTYYTVDFGG